MNRETKACALTESGLAGRVRCKRVDNWFSWKHDNIGYILRNGLLRDVAFLFTLFFELRSAKESGKNGKAGFWQPVLRY
jgi:hypothetical protein